MPIKNIAILGLGLIGGSIAKALKKADQQIAIAGFDKKDIVRQALEEKTIDIPLESFSDSLNSDLIFISLPLIDTIEVLRLLGPSLKKDQIITDVAGVKSILHQEWLAIDSDGLYIGGHPMTGKEMGGYTNSDPLLFENSVYIISDIFRDHKRVDDFVKIIRLLGARIKFLNPDLHDVIVSEVSHLPQLLAVSLINSVVTSKAGTSLLDYAAGGFRDMTRIASSSFDIWEAILRLNKDKISSALGSIIKELETMQIMLNNNSSNEIQNKFETARQFRDEIPKNTKGFLNQLHDIYVFVSDQPGVISKISTTLYEKNINIKDMELLKIREGTGGTFRLAFETMEDARRAEKLLLKLGFGIK